ncbi:MAG: hypothetical protein KF901_10905 [Myxococcales bacterium]|nr:hypothetical protein [Myxococcales bacterium]
MCRDSVCVLHVFWGFAVGCGDCVSHPEPTAPATAAVATVDLDDPSACAACHATVVDEWRTSMHASAHHSNDPIFAALRALRMERQGEQIAAECGSCHHPLAAREPDTPLAAQGVGCRSCHGVAEVKPDGSGHEALVYDEGRALHGALDLAADASPVHGTGPARSHFADGQTLCLACHGEAHNPAGRAAHGFPTGYPGRLAVVQAIARDAAGDEVWRAWREQASERPETMLMRTYVDAEGAPTMPPFAAALARDSRLAPGETRTLRFEVPAAAASAEVSLRFFLIPPPAAATLGLADSPVATPRLVARAEATR